MQAFYFVNDSFSADGRYLWFWCADPPSRVCHLGVLDLALDRVSLYPSTQFLDASPAVHPVTGEAWFFNGCELWKIAPHPDARPELINCLGREISRHRSPVRLATHITFSPKLDAVAIDPGFGRDFYIGEMPLDGSPCRIWQKMDFYVDHAQFSPTDPDVIMFANDGHFDALTGEKIETQKRIWLIRRGETATPLFADIDTPLHGHEWWSRDGKTIWFIHYGQGVFGADPATGAVTREFQTRHPVSHAYSSGDDRLLVMDICPHERNYMQVLLVDLANGQETWIISEMAKLPHLAARYHLHPHPRFCVGDHYIIYSSTLRGKAEIAVTPVMSIR